VIHERALDLSRLLGVEPSPPLLRSLAVGDPREREQGPMTANATEALLAPEHGEQQREERYQGEQPLTEACLYADEPVVDRGKRPAEVEP